jgi:hypothetical protein
VPELTRDEIKEARTAVGWQTTNTFGLATPDPIVILEATGEGFDISASPAMHDGDRLYDVRVAKVYNPVQFDFREAAVRAVLAWKKAKES